MATKPRTRDEATSASPFFVAKPITLPVPPPMPGIRQFIVDPHQLAMERELRAAQLECERTTSYQFAVVPPKSVADCPLGALLALLVRDRKRVLEIGSRGHEGLIDRPVDPAFLWLACDHLHDAWWSLTEVYESEVPDLAEFADDRLGGQGVRDKLATIKPREVVAALTRLIDFVSAKVAANSVEDPPTAPNDIKQRPAEQGTHGGIEQKPNSVASVSSRRSAEHLAIAQSKSGWMLFRRVDRLDRKRGRGYSWDARGNIQVPQGRQTALLDLFLCGGGTLEKKAAAKQFAKPGKSDSDTIAKVVTPAMAKLRTLLKREAARILKSSPEVIKDPVPFDKQLGVWRLDCEIGCAENDDDGDIEFVTKSGLPN